MMIGTVCACVCVCVGICELRGPCAEIRTAQEGHFVLTGHRLSIQNAAVVLTQNLAFDCLVCAL